MSRHLSPLKPASTLGLLALVACDESPAPTGPRESPNPAVAAAVSYSAQDLGGGEIDSRATGINTAGQVVGYTFDPDDIFRVFIWKNGVTTHFRSSLGGDDAKAFDINDVGQVVGSAQNARGKMRAFRWTNGSMTGLGTLGGNESFAFGINNRGNTVGQSRLSGNTRSHAFLVKNGVMTDLGTLGGANSAARDINDAGQVVGWSETATGARHPFLWENGVMKDLFPPGSTSTGTAYAISPIGAVVGERNNRAFRWQNGVFSGLGLAGRGPSVATGIRGGHIVGHVAGRAFVLAGGELTLLPFLPNGVSSVAYAVNGAGVVVGNTIIELDPSCPNGGCAQFDRVTMWTPE
jgi:probable HAF family extracellular repeat protein